ncbi:MAG: endonuclease/exonuclease/phosphatase family protein [Luteolibacter sp.]|jgi:endonuclease/exonuclease/phosphatase (EEP) superfamily protein YafD|nr:endonuclease/exonuclease/phosphatase family protein [Luteolibacter sp.]
MSALRSRTGWTFVGLSLLLHLLTVFCFSRQPDRFAAFTVLPIWVWGGIGLLLSMVAFYFLRASLSLVMTAVWAVTLLVGADEARVLAHFDKSPPQPGKAAPHQQTPVLRVATFNCAGFRYGDPSADIAAWQPDIVLLQDVYPHQARLIADVLYGGHGDYRTHQTNAVLTRWKIQREVRNPTFRDQQVTIALPDGSTIEVVNVHLTSAATDLRFWKRSTWSQHRANRAIRRQELSMVQQVLEQTTAFPNSPTLFGGDFNASATDVVHRQLTRDFIDAFATAGTGWGNTFQRRFPILRIDHLYTTRHFTPLRCRAVMTRHSDHRMVIADCLPGR